MSTYGDFSGIIAAAAKIPLLDGVAWVDDRTYETPKLDALMARPDRFSDAVSHPSHYTANASGVECITVTETFNFNVGNAIKYLWRAGDKGKQIEDLRKAAWYVDREIQRLTSEVAA